MVRKKELLSINIYQLHAPEFIRIAQAVTNELLEKGEAKFESVHIRKDKYLMPAEIHSRVIRSGGQRLILSSIRDITDRKRT